MEENQTMFASYPDVVNVYQLEEMLDISQTLAYSLVRKKAIKSRKIGRAYKIAKSAVINYIVTD